MVTDAISWLCDSPRRLVTVLGGLLLVAIVIGSTVFRGGAPGEDHSGQQARTASTASTVGAVGTTPAAVPDAAPFVTAAVRFVAAWSHLAAGESAAAWHARVNLLSTPQLAAALQQTDVSALPGGTPQGQPSVRYVADSSALVAVPLSTGSVVLVTVVSSGGSWQVSDVQPDEGDGEPVPAAGNAAGSGTGSARPSRAATP